MRIYIIYLQPSHPPSLPWPVLPYLWCSHTPLNPVSAACICMCLGLTPWNWELILEKERSKTGSPSLRSCWLPIACHLGVGFVKFFTFYIGISVGVVFASFAQAVILLRVPGSNIHVLSKRNYSPQQLSRSSGSWNLSASSVAMFPWALGVRAVLEFPAGVSACWFIVDLSNSLYLLKKSFFDEIWELRLSMGIKMSM